MRRFSPWLALGLFAFLIGSFCAFWPTLRAADDASTPQWIWGDKLAGDNQRVSFRKNFTLDGEVKTATVVASCDNALVLFVNGQRVLESNEWQEPVKADVKSKLVTGANTIAVRGENEGGAAGLIVQLELTLASGIKQLIVSDGSWGAAADEPKGWQNPTFDDKAWKKVKTLGKLGVKPWGDIAMSGDAAAKPKPIAKPGSATPPEAITAPPGFKVELLYSVPKPTQGSWVNMTADPKGRLICSDQGGAIYRITPGADAASTKVENLNLPIAAQGLLCAHDVLYVMANGKAPSGNGLYRVSDTNGDDQYDKVELMKKLNGGGEHGPHAIRLGPDGLIYFIAGNHTKIPEGLEPTSPVRHYAEDHLLKRNPDGNGHATGVMAPGGWVARTDKDGKKWELICSGFRNQFDFAFNTDGESFTYDADMEWDTGTPWYRPTRVNHIVSGGEFGWRYGTGKWPAYYADSLGAVVDIGLGSPTGIEFGTGAKFPAKYQRALFILDWTYGKIYAVHMTPQGSSYTATFETFIQGRPLPVTDACINPVDGAMYFTIGGRGTQSGLYRVTYDGKESTAPAEPIVDEKSAAARKLRHDLEKLHFAAPGSKDAKAVATLWPYLNSGDRNLRFAARVALEMQDPSIWKAQAFAEKKTTAAIEAMIALARVGDKSLQAEVLAKLNSLPVERMTEDQTLALLRAYGLAYIRLGGKPADVSATVAKLNPLYPAQSPLLNRELCTVLVYLEAPGVVEKSLKLLSEAATQQDQMFYIFTLRTLKTGWTAEQRKSFFSWINLAYKKYQGGASFKKFLDQIRKDASDTMKPEELASLKEVIAGQSSVEPVVLETTRQFVHNWQMEDLAGTLDKVESGRSFEKGKAAFVAGQCFKCHRFKNEGGANGPDLTGVGGRFTPLYLLEALIDPSKVVSDQYMSTTLETEDGEIITGRVIDEDEKKVRIRTSAFAAEVLEVPKAKIASRQLSKVSEMPQGLINVLPKDEILDLIAYMRSAGDANDKAFKK